MSWPLMLWCLALGLSSLGVAAAASDVDGLHSDQVHRFSLVPRLRIGPGVDDRRALGLGVHMMR